MSSTVTTADAPITREQLRTFHVAGRGLESIKPKRPLRPAALDQLQQLPPFEPAEITSLYEAALPASRTKLRAAFVERLKIARERLLELLAIEDGKSPAGASPERIGAALGREGSTFFNTRALSDALRPRAGATHPMSAERRRRIESTAEVLDSGRRELDGDPTHFLFRNDELVSDPFESALAFCDRRLERFTITLRALRLARLETEAAYDPAVHQELLDRFDWQAADADELLALPPVVVLETADRLATMSFTSFGRVLRSGRPLQILIESSGLYADDLAGFVPDFGYVSIAHREAFVLQSSLSRPDHLTAGLAEMTRSLRPAVAVVSTPAGRGSDAWLATSLLYLSRAFPLYRYDPDGGETWAERFDLLLDEELPVTVADAAAVSERFAHHFRVIPASAWNDDQMELAEYLKQYKQRAPLAVPYIWVTEKGTPQRAIVTRDLVNLARDRSRAWRIFEELAGVRNSYVEAAVARTREEASHLDPERETKARIEGATEAIYRVVAMLSGPAAENAAPSQAPDTIVLPEPAGVEPETALAEDPYIDSFLCTSCNDCFKLNQRMFQYDGNKQAFIADARAGTFAELVKAAEKCPAKCIHPGTPRPDDKTATPQMVARAAKFR